MYFERKKLNLYQARLFLSLWSLWDEKQITKGIILWGWMLCGVIIACKKGHAKIHVGPAYSFLAYDFGQDHLKGHSPTGVGYGIQGGGAWGGWGVQGFLSLGHLKRTFIDQGQSYNFKMKDMYWGIGATRELFFPLFHVRLGMSFHKFSSTVNGHTTSANSIAREMLSSTSKKRKAYYIGVGGEIPVIQKFSAFSEGTFYKFSSGVLYEWLIGGQYNF